MIRPLRKYHFFIWRIIGVALPAAFAAAVIVRPSLPDIEPKTKDAFHAERRTTDSTTTIVLTLNRPLTVPSCLIYEVNKTTEILLGKIDHQGTYQFEINSREKGVTVKLVDPIRHREIKSITLNDEK